MMPLPVDLQRTGGRMVQENRMPETARGLTVEVPHQGGDMPDDPARPHSRGTSITALRRLGPYLRPVRAPMLASGLAVLGSMVCGLTIPLVIQRILDGPVAHRDTGGLPWLVLL